MADRTYVLVWTIFGMPREERGAFCPAGGLSSQEAEDAKARLYEAARAHGVRPVRDEALDRGPSIGAAIVPYVFDVREAFDG